MSFLYVWSHRITPVPGPPERREFEHADPTREELIALVPPISWWRRALWRSSKWLHDRWCRVRYGWIYSVLGR